MCVCVGGGGGGTIINDYQPIAYLFSSFFLHVSFYETIGYIAVTVYTRHAKYPYTLLTD